MKFRISFQQDHRSMFNKKSRCPECGSILIPEGRCSYCRSCGFSSCRI